MLSERVRLVYASDECEIDSARRELRVRGSVVLIGGRAFQFLEVLAQSAGDLITKDELLNSIWPGAIVLENTLAVHAMAVRKALGPYRALLKTESGRGYRLLGAWTTKDQRGEPVPRIDVGPLAKSNLPMPTSDLIGRAEVLQHVRDLISAYRLVTLTGAGGIGKTRVAIEAARTLLAEFQGDVWFVELASLSDTSLIASAIAGALGLSPRDSDISPEALSRAIGGRELLLVIDNCEHLIDAAATTVQTLIRLCPSVSVVVTSRELLRVEGEYTYRVPPLDLPAQEQNKLNEDRIRDSSAVQLFILRMNAQRGGYSDTYGNELPAIAGICTHLDGIPLAIELAAARAATLGGAYQVLSDLGDRFTILTTGRRTWLPRHRTLRATLDWSYQLLTGNERKLLQRLAAFSTAFTIEAARAVAAEGATAAEVADGISNLVAKSLVVRDAVEVAAQFRLLETTRVYAIEKLGESGASNEVSRRHAEYFRDLLGNVDDERKTKPVSGEPAELHRRADEVRTALEWAYSASGDTEIALALTIAAIPLWFALSQIAVVRMRSEQALAYAGASSREEMQLCIALGTALWYSHPDSAAAEPTFARALDIAERISEIPAQLQALWGMWAVRRGRGEYRDALGVAIRYETAARSAGDPGSIHLSDRILGLTHHFLANQVLGRQFAERALTQAPDVKPSSLSF
jgi:predicted ATPase/DNA-binding winged helix-turn-helix (wHTH) protein